MSKAEDFLVEIGTEELPPDDLQNLANAFADGLKGSLTENHIDFNHDQVKIFATPRRLAVLIPHVGTTQPDQLVERRGPAMAAALNADGTPTKAALGFAESCGVTFTELSTQETEKGKWLFFTRTVAGKQTIDLLPGFVEKSLAQLPIKKRMRWGQGDFSFVRPVHWILMLFGSKNVQANIYGVESSNYTFGHRIHHPQPIMITKPADYACELERVGSVIADFAQRRSMIEEQTFDLAAQQNGVPVIEQALLDKVTGLVEYPYALVASFDANFLRVPKECLISAMQDHQKCFAILDRSEKLLPKFILISNIDSIDPQTVVRGNELVMHARLADATFHFDNDQKQTLDSRVERLKTIVYQKQLGSLYDKVLRIEQLAQYIAAKINTNTEQAKRAAHLCKADLVTDMVYEFPELQGIMGYYYALHDGEAQPVAIALKEYYQPKSATDKLPENPIAIALALADRIDTLVGMFGIGNVPTGEKDPYALRRQTLAVLRILIEKNISLDLKDLFAHALKNYTVKINDATDELINFCFERLKAWYLSNNIPAKTFAAVVANNPSNPLDFHQRINAVTKFQALPAAESLAAANKRVQNLLEKSALNAINKNFEINAQLITTAEEKQLYADLQHKETEVAPLMQNADYTAVLQSLATLQAPVDNFFNNVMVMVDDQNLRNNRLYLLQRLRNLFLQVADISLL
jgi:glycyl-tRNA synthetase beta chain